jgi:hypothetical protein
MVDRDQSQHAFCGAFAGQEHISEICAEWFRTVAVAIEGPLVEQD